MATQIFDRETLLDLTVNFIPLFIILFFIVGFAVVNPFGFDPLTSGIQFFLMAMPFVSLAVLTYLSAKAIAGDEKSATVYPPGQATVPGQKPLHEDEEAEGELEAGTDDSTEESGEAEATEETKSA